MSQPQSAPRRAGVSRVLRTEDMPAPMLAALSAAGIPRARLLAAFPADLSPGGRFVERWLVVARDRLAVLDGPREAGRFELGAQERFEGMGAIEYRSMVGGGLVLVRRGEEQKELVRCSRAADRAIQAMLAKLRAHLELEKPSGPEKEEEKRAGEGKDKEDDEEKPPPEALAELPEEAVRVFLGQLDELGEQRYCARCGLPLKQDCSVCPVCVSRGRTLVRIFSFAARYKKQMVLIFTLLVLHVLCTLVPPYMMGPLFDVAWAPETPGPEGYRIKVMLGLVAILFGAEALAVLLRIAAGRMSVTIAGAISRDVRGKVFRHLQFLSLGYFDRHKTGALMSRVGSDTRMLQGFLVNGVQFTLLSILEVTLVTAVLLWLNWRLALLVLIPAPFVLLFTKLVWKKIIRRFRRLWEAMSRLSAVLNDSLRGVRVVKAFGGEEQEVGRFELKSGATYQAEMLAEKAWMTLTPLLNLLLRVGYYLVMVAAGWGLITTSTAFGALSVGLLIQFLTYLPKLYMPMQIMTRLNEWLTRSMTAAERIFEILDTQTEVPEPAEPVAIPRIEGRIELRDAVFGYEKHTPVIKGMSLAVEPGEMIGLVGHSGAGKSTTINLATRLYDVDEGQVLVDGVDVRNIPLKDLRDQIGVVLQETFLFSGTVQENIAYARPEASPREIISAAKMANAHEFIMERPDGYDSEVEEGGGNFSSGEKQRLAIARAILHDPRILILDEATSSVDTKTEKQIQEAVTRLVEGRTTIAIAHRLSTLRDADRLAVIEKGKVKELGTHEELVAKKGVYHELVKTQTEMTSVIAIGG